LSEAFATSQKFKSDFRKLLRRRKNSNPIVGSFCDIAKTQIRLSEAFATSQKLKPDFRKLLRYRKNPNLIVGSFCDIAKVQIRLSEAFATFYHRPKYHTRGIAIIFMLSTFVARKKQAYAGLFRQGPGRLFA
jgi:hypothetical protein